MSLVSWLAKTLLTILCETIHKIIHFYEELTPETKSRVNWTFFPILIGIPLWKWLNRPLNYVTRPDDFYVKSKELSKKAMAQMARKFRKVGKVPPVYPDGWFMLVESLNLTKGDVQYLNIMGLNLAIFRGEDDVVHVLDAYCAHMGANLAAGGQVVNNNCLQCPFHGWIFSGETGNCVSIPYSSSEKIPTRAAVHKYHSVEVNGHVYFWHHRDDIAPAWDIPVIKTISNGSWKYAGRSVHYVGSHIEEIPENGGDVHHLNVLHKANIMFGSDLTKIKPDAGSVSGHKWTGRWSCGEQDGPAEHIGVLDLVHQIYCGGYMVPLLEVNVRAEQIGPGVVHLYLDGGYRFQGVIIQSVTPIEPMLQKLSHQIYIFNYLPRVVGKFLLWSEIQHVERDIMIWNHKMYPQSPVFTTDDVLISKHRKWYSRFYNKNSQNGNLSPYLDDHGRFVETRPWVKQDKLPISYRLDEVF